MISKTNEGKLRGAEWLALVFLLAAVLAAYANSFENAFHFDDFHTIVDNPAVRSLHNVPRFFTDAATFSVLPANRTYRPVVSTSLALDYALGRGYRPLWFHVSTFCWFVLLLWLLFRLYGFMFSRTGAGRAGTWLALLGAAWFGLHPAIAETVNYVIQRGDLYCTLGCVASLALYASHPGWRKAGLYLGPLALALLSKPPAAVFPLLLVLWVYFFETDAAAASPARWRKSGLAAVPSLIVVAMLLVVQTAMTPRSFAPSILSPADYRLTQPYVWLRYVAELFLPLHLNVDTDLAPFSSVNGRALLGILFLACLVWVIHFTARRRELYPVAFGLLWFVLTQLPTSLYPLSEVENDHRMFFSFAGLVPAVVWGGWLLLQRIASPEARRRMQPALAGVLVVVLGLYAFGVHQRNRVWHSEESLWRDDVEKSPHNGRGLMIYGLTQMDKGAYAQALALYNRALLYTPNYATLEINLGVVNGLLGHNDEAERHFQRAVLLAPQDDTSHAYYGRWLLAQGRTTEAIDQLRTAVALNPARLMQHTLLVQALLQNGDIAGAQQAAAEMHANFPGEPVPGTTATTATAAATWINRSLAQYQAGAYQDSVASAQHALALDAKSAVAYNNLGAAYGAMGQWDRAVRAEQQALALDPDLEIARNNLAAFTRKQAPANTANPLSVADWVNRSLVLNQQGRYGESIAAAQAALRLDAHSAEAWNNIAAAYEATHEWHNAIAAAQRALAIRPDFQLAKNNLAWSEQQKALAHDTHRIE